MKKQIVTTLLMGFIGLLYFQGADEQPTYSEDPFVIPAISNICGEETKAWRIPPSVNLPKAGAIPGADTSNEQVRNDTMIYFLQRKADDLSWRSFIALNWPADKNGNADTRKCFVDNIKDESVWEYWMPSTEIYVDSGDTPREWMKGNSFWTQRPKNGGKVSEMRLLAKNNKVNIINPEDLPVIDDDKRYTLYEMYYNKVAYDYVVQNGLYSKAGQKKYTQEWPDYNSGLTYVEGGDTVNIQKRFQRAYFPVGSLKDSFRTDGSSEYYFRTGEGAIIVKSAWMLITKNDDATKFHIREVKLPDGRKVRVGLVAMHIAHKVVEATQWTWASFEHIDNAPTLGADGVAVLEPGKDYSYFDETDNNPKNYNQPPPKQFEPNISHRIGTQVVNVREIGKPSQEINEMYHKMIRDANSNSVWLNYRLVSTQWPFYPTLFTDGSNGGQEDAYQPIKLSNSLMETYKQNGLSCMNCHRQAKFGKEFNNYGFNADFIFGLSTAQ